jgi:Ni,Fe-hydrogenase III component G
VNFENLVEEKFSWQKGYLAFSVSDSGLEKVVEYIKFQKEYHQNRSFEMEHNELLRMHGVYPSVSTG